MSQKSDGQTAISISSLLGSNDSDNNNDNKSTENAQPTVISIDDTDDETNIENSDPVAITKEEFSQTQSTKRNSIGSLLSGTPTTTAKRGAGRPRGSTNRQPRAVTKKQEEQKLALEKQKAEAKAARAIAKANRVARVAKANKASSAKGDTDPEKTDDTRSPSAETSNQKVQETNTKEVQPEPTPNKVIQATVSPVQSPVRTPSTKPNILNLVNPEEPPSINQSVIPPQRPAIENNTGSSDNISHPKPIFAAVPPLHVSPQQHTTIPPVSQSQLSQPNNGANPSQPEQIVPQITKENSKSPASTSTPTPTPASTTSTTKKELKPKPAKTTKAKKQTDAKDKDSKDTKDSKPGKETTKKEPKPKKEPKKSAAKKEEEKKESTPAPTLSKTELQNQSLKQVKPTTVLPSPSFVEITKSTESAKESTAEPTTEPIIALNIPLPKSNEERGTAQVVFNVLKMTEDKYGWKNIHPNASKFAMDLMNDDDMEDDDDAEGAGGADEEEEEKEPPAKVDGRSLQKGKPKIGQYDINDPFIDDAEMLYEEQRASTKDGFFVYYGPLVEEGKNARIERADGTIKRSRKRVAGVTIASNQARKKQNTAPRAQASPTPKIQPATGNKNIAPKPSTLIAIAPAPK